ncbi:hypothetical protein MRB53_036896 [Persea americana]|nr:hypothetical protein MRB53_036896 [Persea americana]
MPSIQPNASRMLNNATLISTFVCSSGSMLLRLVRLRSHLTVSGLSTAAAPPATRFSFVVAIAALPS